MAQCIPDADAILRIKTARLHSDLLNSDAIKNLDFRKMMRFISSFCTMTNI